MTRVWNTTLRLVLDNPEHRKAYDFLKNMDKRKYKSFTNLIVRAILVFAENEKSTETENAKITKHDELLLEEFAKIVKAEISSELNNCRIDKNTKSVSDKKIEIRNSDSEDKNSESVDMDFLMAFSTKSED